MLGSNVSTIGGLTKGFQVGDKWKCDCIQIFLTLSRRWSIPPLTDEKIYEFKKSWSKSSIQCVVAHIPFLVNLASPNNDLWKKSVERLIAEVKIANCLNVPYLVLHPGSYRNSKKESGLRRLIKGLNQFSERIKETSVMILLETMSGQGSMIGSTFKEIKHILNNLNNKKLFGICLDTAHIFHAGYNIVGYKRYDKIIKEFDEIIGLDQIKVIHLNDSKTELGSRNDRHANIGEGKIGLQLFHAVLKDERFMDVPKILEIPERDEKSKLSLELLREIRDLDFIPKIKNFSIQLSIKEIY